MEDVIRLDEITKAYKKEYGDNFHSVRIYKDTKAQSYEKDDLHYEPILWYHQEYRLSLPESVLFNPDGSDRSNHNKVINYLDTQAEEREKYLKKELRYFDILKLAENAEDK